MGIRLANERSECVNRLVENIDGHSGECYPTLACWIGRVGYITERFSVCHSFLSSGSTWTEGDILWNYPNAFNGMDMPLDCNDKSEDALLLRRYHTFLMNDPFIGQVYETKDYDEACRYGQLLDLDANQSWGMVGIVASRMPREFPERVRLWGELTDRGMAPRKALMLCECVQSPSSNYDTRDMAEVGVDELWLEFEDHGHQCFDMESMTVNEFKVAARGEVYRPENDQPLLDGFCSFNKCMVVGGRGERVSQIIGDLPTAEREVYDYWGEKDTRTVTIVKSYESLALQLIQAAERLSL